MVQSLREIIEGPPVSAYTGSKVTMQFVKMQIAKRFGRKESEKYDPYTNALPLVRWNRLGYRVKPGAKAIRAVTFVEVKDALGKVTQRIPRPVFLFYYLDVHKVRFN
ncbi:MAG: hypothetical protein Q8R36_00630 [bacterium]|nr:hypothetical protein [bacterium]